MPSAERKARNQRHTSLTCGVMAEVLFGTTLLVWSGSPATADRAVFGPTGSTIAVAAAMLSLAVAMVLAVLAPRLSRGVLVAGVSLFSLVIACVGVVAIAMLTIEPGTGFLLAIGCVLAIPVSLEIRRASGPRTRPNNSRQG